MIACCLLIILLSHICVCALLLLLLLFIVFFPLPILIFSHRSIILNVLSLLSLSSNVDGGARNGGEERRFGIAMLLSILTTCLFYIEARGGTVNVVVY